MDAIERVEISIKTKLIYEMSHSYGPFGYTIPSSLPELRIEEHSKLIETIQNEVDRSKEEFVAHFKKKYGDEHKYLPLWMSGEIMSFGSMLTMFKGTDSKLKWKIAKDYGINTKILGSWLQALNVIRNICAHHSRLWNKELGYRAILPYDDIDPDWYLPVPIVDVRKKLSKKFVLSKFELLNGRLDEFFVCTARNDIYCKDNTYDKVKGSNLPEKIKIDLKNLIQPNQRVFVILTILKYMLNVICPQSNWKQRLYEFLDEYPDIPRLNMGFPENWKENNIWKK